MKKLLLVIPLMVLLTGCDERYRYLCQNPENWENKYCQKPYCSANGTCPEDLRHYEKEKFNGTPSKSNMNSGGTCK